MAAMIHLGAVLPQLHCAASGHLHYSWLADDSYIIEGPKLAIRGRHDGFVPKGPGLGVNLDRDKVARAHEVYRKSGMTRQRDDGPLDA